MKTEIYTPAGKTNGQYNSKVANGELLIEYENGVPAYGSEVTDGKSPRQDDVNANVDGNTLILSKKNGFADLARGPLQTLNYLNGLQSQVEQRAQDMYSRYNQELERQKKYRNRSSLSVATSNYINNKMKRLSNSISDVVGKIEEQKQDAQAQIENVRQMQNRYMNGGLYESYMNNPTTQYSKVLGFNGGKDPYKMKVNAYYGRSDDYVDPEELPPYDKTLFEVKPFEHKGPFDIPEIPINMTTPPKQKWYQKLEDKLKGFDSSDLSYIPAAIGGIRQLIDSGRPKSIPNLRTENPYEQMALTTMAKRKSGVYDQLGEIDSNLRRTLFSIRGQNGPLRQKLALAAQLDAGRQRREAIFNSQQLNNAYLKDYAEMAKSFGSEDRQYEDKARINMHQFAQQANKAAYDLQQAGLTNLSNVAQQLAANRFKRNIANKRIAYYDTDTKNIFT